MAGVFRGLVSVVLRGGVAAFALVLFIHGSTKRPVKAAASASPPVASRSLTAEDFARGFAHVRTGTGEPHGFAPPPGAEVCADWLAFGAAEDWVYLDLAASGWSFPCGTGSVDRLRVHSGGRVDLSADAALAPLAAPLGIAPAANWPRLPESGRPCRFWHFLTPSNTLVLAWENALLNRSAEFPVSFAAELRPDGGFDFRYDLSRVPPAALAGVSASASTGGEPWGTNAPVESLTSLSFRRVNPPDASDPDRDGDGVPTADELFLYGTDPGLADTDADELTDFEELFVHRTDPLDPHSVRPDVCDGIAVRLGGCAPLDRSTGSTNSVLEHVFYAGAADAPFALPQPSDSVAVLRVAPLGSGAGELLVGGRPVPLLAPGGPELLVAVERGRTVPLALRGDSGLAAALGSEDFAFGEHPSLNDLRRPGWIRFPGARPSAPCIHNLATRRVRVSLPVGPEDGNLSCSWSSANPDVSVANEPPRAATVSGRFPPHSVRTLSYALSHPKALFGSRTFTQSVRFCPKPAAGDPSADWNPGGEETNVPPPAETVREDVADRCAMHDTDRALCAPLHWTDYTNALARLPRSGGLLHLREPPVFERVRLDVPESAADGPACCPCPDHRTNRVSVAFRSARLRVENADGTPFAGSPTSCTVRVSGVAPSAAPGDAVLAFERGGELGPVHAWTVLGVGIGGGRGTPLATYRRLSDVLGLPVTVGGNDPWYAPELRLSVRVGLPDGRVRVALGGEGAGGIGVWWYDSVRGEWRVLLGPDAPERDFAVSEWRELLARAGRGNSPDLPVRVTAASPGRAALSLRYWTEADGELVEDAAEVSVTAVLPPLRFDQNRDGSIDGGDFASWLGGRSFHYWVNEDRTKGDFAGDVSDVGLNADDLRVNGRYDLINFFPVALDLKPFLGAWGGRVTYRVVECHGLDGAFNWCLADVPWSQAGAIQTEMLSTLDGEELATAHLSALPADGVELPYDGISRLLADSGALVCEARRRGATLRLEIALDGETIYSYTAPMDILPVREMYGWISGRGDALGYEAHTVWEEKFTRTVVFLHGFNVSEDAARTWGDVMFKRMWIAGMRANFCNVMWRGDVGSGANYQENVSNAFAAAAVLVPALREIPGEKVLVAHSLGNVVASSMIQDYGLTVSRYIMCNSAVPAEAYDTSLETTNVLVHADWNDYPVKSRANEWYRLFEADANDGRGKLTWRGRFTDVADVAVNFYSTGDHVLELEKNNNVWATDGYENWSQKFERYSWHKQELWKGRKGLVARLGTTDWSGWGVRENLFGYNLIQSEEARQMSDAELRTNTVFRLNPASMNATNIPRSVVDAHLAMGIPSRTPASGAMCWGDNDNMGLYMFNLDAADILRPNGWPIRSNGWFGNWGNRWLHSDIKDVAYFYVFKLFEKITEVGGLNDEK